MYSFTRKNVCTHCCMHQLCSPCGGIFLVKLSHCCLPELTSCWVVYLTMIVRCAIAVVVYGVLCRVVQKNLVFVVGLSPRLCDAEILRRHEYFGKFGKIHKVVINQSTSYVGSQVSTQCLLFDKSWLELRKLTVTFLRLIKF